MSQPHGFRHRHKRGPIGILARWWYRRRVRQIKRARDR